MKRVFVLVVVAFSAFLACKNEPPTDIEQQAFDQAWSGWRMAGLPDLDDCLEGATVEYVPRDEFNRRCSPQQPGLAANARECLDPNSGSGFFGKWIVLLTETPYPSMYRDVCHSGLHALIRCAQWDRRDRVSELFKGTLPFDGRHTSPLVWENHGPQTAEALANCWSLADDG